MDERNCDLAAPHEADAWIGWIKDDEYHFCRTCHAEHRVSAEGVMCLGCQLLLSPQVSLQDMVQILQENRIYAVHDHWDSTMQRGRGCRTCIAQRRKSSITRQVLYALEWRLGGEDE